MQTKMIESRSVVACGQDRGIGKVGRKRFQRDLTKMWRVIDMFIILIMVMVLWWWW